MSLLLSFAPEVTPELVNAVASHEERAPWLAVVLALSAIVAVMVAGLVWVARSALPWVAAQLAAHRESLQQMINQRGADADRLATMAVGSAHKELGERVADVHEAVTETHETTKAVQRQLASIAAKVGAPVVLLLLLWLALRPPAAAGYRGELARVGTGEPGVTPAPGKLSPPGPVRKDCDSTTCKPPGRCERGQCVGSARKPAPTKLAGQAMGASSYAVRAAWQDTEPEAFPERLSDAQWLAQQL